MSSRRKVKAIPLSDFLSSDKKPVHTSFKNALVGTSDSRGMVPHDFWEPHKVPPPKILREISVGKQESSEKFFKNIQSKHFGATIPKNILQLLKKGKVQDVRGNGKCGIYAILVQLFIRFPVLTNNIDHQTFMELLHPFMSDNHVEKDPQDIDADVLIRFMSEFFASYYFSDIDSPSFAVLSSDGTIKFVASTESSKHPSNLFVILHNSGHYKALILTEDEREELFSLLTDHEKSGI